MIRIARIVSAPFLFLPAVILLIVYGEQEAHDFLDSVDQFFDGL